MVQFHWYLFWCQLIITIIKNIYYTRYISIPPNFFTVYNGREKTAIKLITNPGGIIFQ